MSQTLNISSYQAFFPVGLCHWVYWQQIVLWEVIISCSRRSFIIICAVMLKYLTPVLSPSCCTVQLLINLPNQLKRHGQACVTVCASCINVYLVLHNPNQTWYGRVIVTPHSEWSGHERSHRPYGFINKTSEGAFQNKSVCRESIRFLNGAQHAFMNKRQGLEYPAFIVDTLLLRLYKMSRSKSRLTRVVN